MSEAVWLGLIGLATPAALGAKYLIDRHDRIRAAREEKATRESEAEKTVRTQAETIAAKNAELGRVYAERDQWRHRAEHLETLVYSRGQQS